MARILEWLPALRFFDDPLYLLLIPYVLFQPVFRWYVESSGVYEKNKDLSKRIMAAYNMIMAVFSLFSFVMMAYSMCFLPHGVFALGHYSEPTGWYRRVTHYFYLSKYIEFLDTYFLILCSRPVSWLQYIHHIGAPLDMGIWYNYEVEGAWIFVLFNGFIHSVMYSYYACCIMKWPFPWKRIVTSLQLVQFFSGLTIVLGYLNVDGFMTSEVKRVAFYFNYLYVGVLVILFGNFYYQTYVIAPKKKQSDAKAAAAAKQD